MAGPLFRTPPQVTQNAMTVLEKRYLWKDGNGVVAETPRQMLERVSDAVASVEKRDRQKWADLFYGLMASRRFLPNSPALMNAGREKGQLAACFVLPVGDSLDEIFDSLKAAAKIHQSGGGTGFSFSRIRPRGSRVKSSEGVASGPVSFMRIFDVATETIKQGGTRRGANMAILRVDHVDIQEFVESKRDQKSILNFNISVGVTDEFMTAVKARLPFELKDPRDGRVVRQIAAKELFDQIAKAAWECGDPGLVFLDRINRFNPTPQAGPMESTNPCVTGDTRVLVQDKGWIPIRELVGSSPWVATEIQGRAGYRKATKVFCTGVRPVLRLSTQEGYELRLTEEHLVFTDRGDVPAKDLAKGDRVRLYQCEQPQIQWDNAHAALGEIVGWLTGDGHFTHHGEGKRTAVLSFYGMDKQEAAGRLLKAVQAQIGDHSISLNQVDQRDLAYIRSQRLYAALGELGVNESCKDSVPELVWRGSLGLVAGYLRALFSADGSVQGNIEKGVSVRLSTIKLELLRGVQTLLLGFGIKSSLYKYRKASGKRLMPDSLGKLREYECAANHELVISKTSLPVYAKTIGFLIQHKQEKLETLLRSYTRGPYQEDFYATVEESYFEGEEEVFDLTEPGTSHFHANGILVHNCGEQPLLPFESCNLGSLNLGEYWIHGAFDWEMFRQDIHSSVRFLDNVVDLNSYPVLESERITLRNRKVGLGVMGFADLLLLMNLSYSEPESRVWGEKIMSFLDREAKSASAELALSKGIFPNWKGSIWDRLGYPKMRNATTTTVAPTGTISILAGASSGIEPIFSGVFFRNVLGGEKLIEIHPAVEKVYKAKGLSLRDLTEDRIVQELGPAWTPASKVSVEDHVRMQAVFQRHSDSAVSKTINLSESATVADVSRAYLLAYEQGCKGITVYRDRSRPTQVLERLPEEKMMGVVCVDC